MGKVVEVNKLSTYLDRLKEARKKQDPNAIAYRIAEEGEKIALSYYRDGRDPDEPLNITVKAEKAENGKAKIVARGKGLVYLEYGIGKLGEQSNYKFYKPVSRTFFSKKLNRDISLTKWTYNYAHKKKKSLPEIDGHKAYAQMFNTARDLKRRYAGYIRRRK